MGKIFLQFGEAANSSLVHLWNYSKLEEGNYVAEVQKKLLENGISPKTLIYSVKLGLKGIIAEGSVTEKLIESSSTAKEIILNQKTGRWTDFNYATEFPESSYRELPEFDTTKNFLSSFYDSKSKTSFLDSFEEDTRKLAESCDWMEGFNIVSESCGAVGASTLHALEHLNDEYSKSSKTVISFHERFQVDPIAWENCDKFDGEEVGKALKLALTFNSISEQNVTFIPLTSMNQCNWEPFNFDMKNPQESCRFFSSIFFDLFVNQSIPGKGNFASLMTSIKDQSFSFTTNQFSDSILSKFRNVPIIKNVSNYEFENVEMIAYADFNSNPFTVSAAESLEAIKVPRSVWRQLESAGVADELAAGDYYNEILETLHQIKDLSEPAEFLDY